MWQWLKDQLSAFSEWLVDVLLWVPLKLCELVLAGLSSLINGIPVPEWLSDLSYSAAALDPGVAFFLNMLQVPAGLAMLGSAYGIRFLIRRIPVIG